jgi:capsular polysaccharide export protein
MHSENIRFIKLDTRVIEWFDEALCGRCETVHTSIVAIISALVRRRGPIYAARALCSALVHRDDEIISLVAGNVLRKNIRLPALFGNPLISRFYAAIKGAQATLLLDVLTDKLAHQDKDRLVAIIFNGSLFPESILGRATHGFRRVLVESGFFPNTLQIDAKGVNAANSVPRTKEFYLSGPDFASAGLPPNTVAIRRPKREYPAREMRPGYVFVPFQVPSDMQVTVHSPWIRDMYQFYDLVIEQAETFPDDTFVIKEHPSFKLSVVGSRPSHPRIIFANGNPTAQLIMNSRSVMTLNSTVGIEALLSGKQVITLGDACYNIQDLVLHAPDRKQLNKALEMRDWLPDERLRRQFLGFLWNRYLVKGGYLSFPPNLADEILARCGATGAGRLQDVAMPHP